jgi:hypothetical protein
VAPHPGRHAGVGAAEGVGGVKLTPAQRRLLRDIAQHGPLGRWVPYDAGHQTSVIARCEQAGWIRWDDTLAVQGYVITDAGRRALARCKV